VNVTEQQLKDAPKYSEHEGWDWADPARRKKVSWPDAIYRPCCCVLRTSPKSSSAPSRPKTAATGPKGEAAPTIIGWDIDAASYTATPLLSGGQKGPPLQLRDLFKQFIADTR
jgi:hypothetical protein